MKRGRVNKWGKKSLIVFFGIGGKVLEFESLFEINRLDVVGLFKYKSGVLIRRRGRDGYI